MKNVMETVTIGNICIVIEGRSALASVNKHLYLRNTIIVCADELCDKPTRQALFRGKRFIEVDSIVVTGWKPPRMHLVQILNSNVRQRQIFGTRECIQIPKDVT